MSHLEKYSEIFEQEHHLAFKNYKEITKQSKQKLEKFGINFNSARNQKNLTNEVQNELPKIMHSNRASSINRIYRNKVIGFTSKRSQSQNEETQ